MSVSETQPEETEPAELYLVDSLRLRALADRLDKEQDGGRWASDGSRDVQKDLRRMASAIQDLQRIDGIAFDPEEHRITLEDTLRERVTEL